MKLCCLIKETRAAKRPSVCVNCYVHVYHNTKSNIPLNFWISLFSFSTMRLLSVSVHYHGHWNAFKMHWEKNINISATFHLLGSVNRSRFSEMVVLILNFQLATRAWSGDREAELGSKTKVHHIEIHSHGWIQKLRLGIKQHAADLPSMPRRAASPLCFTYPNWAFYFCH